MAIIIEEEKNRSNIVRALGWFVIVAIIGAIIYYVFFAAPQLAIIEPSGNLNTIAPIVENNIDPNQLVNSAAFKALQSPPANTQVSTSTGLPTGGRANPFITP